MIRCTYSIGFLLLLSLFLSQTWRLWERIEAAEINPPGGIEIAVTWSQLVTTNRPKKSLQRANDLQLAASARALNRTRSSLKLLVLHLGKAGGGTVQARFQDWQIPYYECHPHPCPSWALGNSGPPLLITIRDPVDRFVSAYHWRKVVSCHPDGDERQTVTGRDKRLSFQHPEKYCKMAGGSEEKVLFRKFPTISSLAQALCSNPKAAKYVQRIGHMVNLRQWTANITREVYPIVLERGFDLPQQVDATLRLFLPDEPVPPLTKMDKSMAHSSVHHGANHTLSKEEESCVLEFLKEDYTVLRNMACPTTLCREAIDSILYRRGFKDKF